MSSEISTTLNLGSEIIVIEVITTISVILVSFAANENCGTNRKTEIGDHHLHLGLINPASRLLILTLFFIISGLSIIVWAKVRVYQC